MAEEQLFGGANVKKKPARSAYEAMKRGFLGDAPIAAKESSSAPT